MLILIMIRVVIILLKEKKIMELAMEQKRKNGKTNAVTYKL